VGAGPLALGDAPFPQLVPDAAGHADHADVVHQGRAAQHDDIGGGKPERLTCLSGQFGHRPGMADAQR